MTTPLWPNLVGATPVPSALTPGGPRPAPAEPVTTCDGCGSSEAPFDVATHLCRRCTVKLRSPGTMSAVSPSQLPVERDRELRAAGEKDARKVRQQFEEIHSSISTAIINLEQGVRDLQLAATQVGQVESPLTGRAVASIRDELLADVRTEVAAALQRIDVATWAAL